MEHRRRVTVSERLYELNHLATLVSCVCSCRDVTSELAVIADTSKTLTALVGIVTSLWRLWPVIIVAKYKFCTLAWCRRLGELIGLHSYYRLVASHRSTSLVKVVTFSLLPNWLATSDQSALVRVVAFASLA